MKDKVPDFREIARTSLERAKSELNSDDPTRFRYAALELRDAIEAITYDWASALKDDIHPDEYKKWQPRILMARLLEIDPSIGSMSTISVGEEEKYGIPAPRRNMKIMGTEYVLTLKDIKDHYDRIGSYLHMPSLDQIHTGKIPDVTKLKVKCENLAGDIEKILSSTVWNISFGLKTTLPQCVDDSCKKPIRRRMRSDKDLINVRCFECKAEYIVTRKNNTQLIWTPKLTEISCSNLNCSKKILLWPRELVPGAHWHCSECGFHNGLNLTVTRILKKEN